MRKIVIANWKMNPQSQKEAEVLFRAIVKSKNSKKIDVVICPPVLYIEKLNKISSKMVLGAQNIFYEKKGPFTGEISAGMLKDIGVEYIIIGHSERRSLGETNLDVNKKIKTALSCGLKPVVCVGEIERDENHKYFNIIKNQIEECLGGLSKSMLSKIIIAYEPVWALSTTLGHKDATSLDSCEMSIFIKKIISDKFGLKIIMPRIIYGGSVDDKNCADFLINGGVSGVLVGGASLNADKFLKIINIAGIK
ncbi:MAG: triose-phosphate isomerase [Candidatus Paceibacterota bacterium]